MGDWLMRLLVIVGVITFFGIAGAVNRYFLRRLEVELAEKDGRRRAVETEERGL